MDNSKINKLPLIIICLILSIYLSGCYNIDLFQVKKEIKQKKEQLTARQTALVNSTLDKWNKLSLLELKDEVKFLQLKLKSSDEYSKEDLEDLVNSNKPNNYLEEEDKYISEIEQDPSKALSEYLKYIKSGLYFNQHHKGANCFVKVIHNKDKKHPPKPKATFGAYPSVQLNTIYSENSKKQTNITASELNNETFNINKNTLIDSIKVRYSIPYISKIDSIVINSDDVGEEIDRIQILAFSGNCIAFKESNKLIFETKAYNIDGKQLKLQTENTHHFYKKKTNKHTENQDKIISDLENTNSDSIARYLAENFLLNSEINYNHFIQKVLHFKSHISKVVIKYERKREYQNADITFKNRNINQQLFINQIEKETVFMNRKGEILFKMPQLNFEYIENDKKIRCSNYVKNQDGNGNTIFYHVDINNKKLHELKEAKSIKILNENLVQIEGKRDAGYKDRETMDDMILAESLEGRNCILYNSNHKKISDKVYLDVSYNKVTLIGLRKDKTYFILDSLGNEIEKKDFKHNPKDLIMKAKSEEYNDF